MTGLLPPVSTPIERAIAAAVREELTQIPPSLVSDMADPEKIPTPALGIALRSAGSVFSYPGASVAVRREARRRWTRGARRELGTLAGLRNLVTRPLGAIVSLEPNWKGHHTLRITIRNPNTMLAPVTAYTRLALAVLPASVHLTVIAGGLAQSGQLLLRAGTASAALGRVAEG